MRDKFPFPDLSLSGVAKTAAMYEAQLKYEDYRMSAYDEYMAMKQVEQRRYLAAQQAGRISYQGGLEQAANRGLSADDYLSRQREMVTQAFSDPRGEFKKKPKNLREELQQQTDEWLKGV